MIYLGYYITQKKLIKSFLNFVDEINQVVDAIELESYNYEEYYKHELV